MMMMMMMEKESAEVSLLIDGEVLENRELLGHLLALADLGDLLAREGRGVGWVARHHLPVREGELREGEATGVLAKQGVEAEGLDNGQVGLDLDEVAEQLVLLFARIVRVEAHDTAADAERAVHTSDVGARDGDAGQEDGLDEADAGGKLGSVQGASGQRLHLGAAAVARVGVEFGIEKVEADAAQGLVRVDARHADFAEGADDGLLDLVQVVDGLCAVDEDVGGAFELAERPELLGVVGVPGKVGGQLLGEGLAAFGVCDTDIGGDVATVDGLAQVLREGLGGHLQAVVLVGRLGSAGLGLGSDGLHERDSGLGDDEGHVLEEVLAQVLQADLEVELAATGDDGLAGLGSEHLDGRVGLDEAAEAKLQLGAVLAVLDSDSDTHDRGHGEVHGLEDVGVRVRGKRA